MARNGELMGFLYYICCKPWHWAFKEQPVNYCVTVHVGMGQKCAVLWLMQPLTQGLVQSVPENSRLLGFSIQLSRYSVFHISHFKTGKWPWDLAMLVHSRVSRGMNCVTLAQIPGCYPLSKFCSTAVSRDYSGQLFTGACIPYNYELHQL